MKKLEIFVKDFPLEFSIKKYKFLLEEFDSIKIFYKTKKKLEKFEAKQKIIREVNRLYYNIIKIIPKNKSYFNFIKNIQKAKLDFL